MVQLVCTVEPHFTDTYLIWAPRYYRQFSLSLGKALTMDTYFLLSQQILIRLSLEANLANEDISLLNVCCNKPFLLEGKNPSVDSMSIIPALPYTGQDDL